MENQTSEIKFKMNEDKSNAYANIPRNVICIGKNVFTIETIIHEINEIVTTHLIHLDSEHDTITMIKDATGMLRFAKSHEKLSYGESIFNTWVSHLISPYGQNSLIDPYTCIENEEFLVIGDNEK